MYLLPCYQQVEIKCYYDKLDLHVVPEQQGHRHRHRHRHGQDIDMDMDMDMDRT